MRPEAENLLNLTTVDHDLNTKPVAVDDVTSPAEVCGIRKHNRRRCVTKQQEGGLPTLPTPILDPEVGSRVDP